MEMRTTGGALLAADFEKDFILEKAKDISFPPSNNLFRCSFRRVERIAESMIESRGFE